MIENKIIQNIEVASQVLGKTWPLYAFVTSNPLSGYEKKPFLEAVSEAKVHTSNNFFPKVEWIIHNYQNGNIEKKEIKQLLRKHSISYSVEETIQIMKKEKTSSTINPNNKLDKIIAKWLMAFLDEGLAEWQMPNKEKGFYVAWKSLVRYDREINQNNTTFLSDTSLETLQNITNSFSQEECVKIFQHHLLALSGFTGYIKYRVEENSPWQKKYPITLVDYLAVRLSIATALNISIKTKDKIVEDSSNVNKLYYLWLKAWELSSQYTLSKQLSKQLQSTPSPIKKKPDAQLVFCIDTRSELIRRHIENNTNYETFGYAGFFGIAMDYENVANGLAVKSCPPIVPSNYIVSENPVKSKTYDFEKVIKQHEKKKIRKYFLNRMKNMLPSSFGFVEGAGFFYGISLFLKTLFSKYLYPLDKNLQIKHEHCSEPILNTKDPKSANLIVDFQEKVNIVKSAFTMMGWQHFSDFIIFVGHASSSTNNPFASSLHCGACAASPGRHNARLLAKFANDTAIRNVLVQEGFTIPSETFFIAAEHNTTTDSIEFFESNLTTNQQEKLKRIKSKLGVAQKTAIQEKLKFKQAKLLDVYKKSKDWSETRPEWGLSKNSAFIIGQREISKNINLNGQCFLHSYNWQKDTSGHTLEKIMQGPMVVTQWINNHYYFSTVDNQNYGGGSKIFHNITGRFGVVLGNGSDLKRGLPLQSVFETDQKAYHQPLRLSVYIHAPKSVINSILHQNKHLSDLVHNQWIYIIAIDPTDDNTFFRYEEKQIWQPFLNHNKSIITSK